MNSRALIIVLAVTAVLSMGFIQNSYAAIIVDPIEVNVGAFPGDVIPLDTTLTLTEDLADEIIFGNLVEVITITFSCDPELLGFDGQSEIIAPNFPENVPIPIQGSLTIPLDQPDGDIHCMFIFSGKVLRSVQPTCPQGEAIPRVCIPSWTCNGVPTGGPFLGDVEVIGGCPDAEIPIQVTQTIWISIPPKPCADPLIDNSNSEVCDGTASGETCEVTCNSDFFVLSGPVPTCQNGQWNTVPTCEPLFCPLCGDGTRFNENTIECDPIVTQAQLDVCTGELATCGGDLTLCTDDLATCGGDLTLCTDDLATCGGDLTTVRAELGAAQQQIAEFEDIIEDLENSLITGPSEIINSLILQIQTLVDGDMLEKKDSKKVLKDLDKALKDLQKGNEKACKDVSKFVKDANKLVKKGDLTSEKVQPLLDDANALLAECPVKDKKDKD